MRKLLTAAILLFLALPLAAAGEDPVFPERLSGSFALPLSKAANRGFRDEVAGDGVGGWTDQGGNDFRHMPVGDQTLCGVPFRILDPAKNGGKSCLVLRGHGLKGLPDSVTVAVGRKGGALVFLHALAWGDEQPVARYVVHYVDGQTAEVPVVYGRGVDHWISRQPRGLENASMAWAAPSPGEQSDEQTVVYPLQWNNPRPEVPIRVIDLLYGPQGSQFGTPVLLAITAATEAR